MMSNPNDESLFFASGAMDISDDNGRSVINKMQNGRRYQNPEYNPDLPISLTNPLYLRDDAEFAGADRPELVRTLEGFDQVCVEKESENILPASARIFDPPTSSWRVTDQPLLFNVSQGHEIPNVTSQGTRIQYEGDQNDQSSNIKGVQYDGIPNVLQGEPWSFSSVIYNIGENPVKLHFRRITDNNLFQSSESVLPGEIKRVDASGFAAGDGGSYLLMSSGIGGVFSNEKIDFIAFKPQVERSPYPTQFTEGIRLKPLTVFQDAIPALGAIFGEVDMIRDDSLDQGIFDTNGDSSTSRSIFDLISSNDFRLFIFGSAGGSFTQPNPFTDWNNTSRKKFKFGISYNSTNLYLYLSDSINTYFYSYEHSINSVTVFDIKLGYRSNDAGHSSIYFKLLGKSTEIPTSESEFTTLLNKIL